MGLTITGYAHPSTLTCWLCDLQLPQLLLTQSKAVSFPISTVSTPLLPSITINSESTAALVYHTNLHKQHDLFLSTVTSYNVLINTQWLQSEETLHQSPAMSSCANIPLILDNNRANDAGRVIFNSVYIRRNTNSESLGEMSPLPNCVFS